MRVLRSGDGWSSIRARDVAGFRVIGAGPRYELQAILTGGAAVSLRTFDRDDLELARYELNRLSGELEKS